MAKTWNDFLPLLTPIVPGVPDATAKTYLAQAAADFFARTYLWRRDLDPITLTRNVAEYDVDVYIRGGVVEDLRSVRIDGNEIPLQRLMADAVPADHLDVLGTPRFYWLIGDSAIGVYPTPDARYILRLNAVLKTSRAATEVDDWVYETWADDLVAGAAARILDIPGKEWSNPTLAAAYRMQFERAIVRGMTAMPRPLLASVRTAEISVQMKALRGCRPRPAIVRSMRLRSAELSR